jgi:cbb3-type cytochrome oxidase maturation protein
MEIIYLLVPGSLLLVLIFLVLYLLAARSGQFDDLDTPQWRALFDDVEQSLQDCPSGAEDEKSK